MNDIDLSVDSMANYPNYEQAKARGLVEAGIVPLCDVLASLGAKPLASCEGHANTLDKPKLFNMLFGPTVHWLRPYVVFTAPYVFASQLSRAIVNNPNLFFNWHVLGKFAVNNEFVWLIEPNDYRIKGGSDWIERSVADSEGLVRRDVCRLSQIILASQLVEKEQAALVDN
ncbi:hypothetical protein [Vibrio sp. Hal054]|uniref:hypothetical protein n=1 Tax=Vibrio sp. Hal054 TaxID=3035158 RepID=UPI00301CAE05